MSSTTIFAVIVAVSNAIVAVFGYMLAKHNAKNDKNAQREEKTKEAEDKIDQVCNSGSLSELIDATKELGKAKK